MPNARPSSMLARASTLASHAAWMKQTEVSELAEEFPVVEKITILDAERIETVLMLLALQALLYFNPKVLVFFSKWLG